MDLTKIYTSIEDLPLYNFDKIDTTSDLMWLYEDFNGRQPKTDTKELQPIYETIFNQYFEALEDRSMITRLQKMARKDALVLKCNIVIGLLHRISQGFDNQETRYQFLEALKKWGYTIPTVNTYEHDLKDCQAIYEKLKSVNIQIALLDNELKRETKSESTNLQKQMIIVSQGLQLGYRVNPKEVTVKEWIEMLKLLKTMNDGE